jgi:uncharacterized protein YcfJ
MGGGPVEGEDDIHDSQGLSGESSRRLSASSVAGSNVLHLQPHLSPTTTEYRQDRERPVLTCAVEAGVLGGILGSFIGFGSVFGSTAGALAGASIASRDDALGQQARERALTIKNTLENEVTKAVGYINDQPAGHQVLSKLGDVLQTISDTSERLKVQQRTESVAVKLVEIAEPKVRNVYAKVLEADRHGILDKCESVFSQADQAVGFTRTYQALRRELR